MGVTPSRIACPWCKGKAGVDPFAQEDDPTCRVCKGEGSVFDAMCICGRPALVNGAHGPRCGKEECMKAAEVVQPYEKWWGEEMYGGYS